MEFVENSANKHKCVGTWLASGIGRKDEAHQFDKELGYEITGYRFVNRF
ncbi:GNAT family N-acetyltransferase [Peribacillus sp. NPDC096622]